MNTSVNGHYSMRLVLAMFAGFIIFFSGTAMGYDDKTEISLKKAAVYAMTYDAAGKVDSVSLLSYEGEDYLVAPNEIGRKLFPLVEHTVNVDGTVRIDE
jgi:hypothetical protein